jgi:hypothetical protein
MLDIFFAFTTKLFNTNPPKLWPISTIGQSHLHLHKTYALAMIISLKTSKHHKIPNSTLKYFKLVAYTYLGLKYLLEGIAPTLFKTTFAYLTAHNISSVWIGPGPHHFNKLAFQHQPPKISPINT